MRKLLPACAVAVAAFVIAAPTSGAYADDGGRVAAGIAGGVLGGMLLGGALAPRPVYPPPPPHYGPPPYGPPPGYVDYDGPPPPQHCYWTRGQPVWDDAYGVWRRPRVEVCE